jgi:hypothetical protein
MAIKDPTHEEHRSMLHWVGDLFHPVGRDMPVVHRRLSTLNT